MIRAISRPTEVSADVQARRLAPFLELGFWRSLDMSGDELAQPASVFKPLYRAAKKAGIRLKAHVGEWGDADTVQRAVEDLELDEVQHGISAARSPSVMRFLADNRIQLNISLPETVAPKGVGFDLVVADIGNGLGCPSLLQAQKAPAHQDDLGLAVFALADHRRHVPGKDGVHGFERGATVVRDAEEAPDVILFGGERIEIAHPGCDSRDRVSRQ